MPAPGGYPHTALLANGSIVFNWRISHVRGAGLSGRDATKGASLTTISVIFLLVSTGATELLIMFLEITLGLPLPLIPVQLLWLNLVAAGIQDIALPFEPGEGDTLRRGPRPPDEGIFDRLMIEHLEDRLREIGDSGLSVLESTTERANACG